MPPCATVQVRNLPRQVAAVVEKPLQPLVKAGQIADHPVVEHFHGKQRNEADQRADGQPNRFAVDLQMIVVEAILARPTGRRRRGCSWRRRWPRNARRTSRPRPRRPNPRWASSRAIASMVDAIERHPGGAVGLFQEQPPPGSGLERSNTPMLSSPRKPPEKRCLPATSLRLTHQVKLISSF